MKRAAWALVWSGAIMVSGALLGGFLLFPRASAAQGPAVVDKPVLVQFSATPLYDDAGGLSSLKVTATFRVMMLMPDGKEKRPHLRNVEFDLVQNAGQTVILGNQLVEFGDIGADLVGVAEFAWKLQNPDPLPVHPAEPIVRRKTLRAK